ncbi:MAG TPA: histidinol-phosphatase, partial [Brevundimonas sp.]|nr:histidinol-phosphatase [Brevundimonas sp.]
MTEYEAFAIELAREAARVTLPFFRSDISHEDKGGPAGFDPVTEADKQAEA